MQQAAEDYMPNADQAAVTVRLSFPGISDTCTAFAVEEGCRNVDALEEAAALLSGAMAIVRLLARGELAGRDELAGACLHSLYAGSALIESVQRSLTREVTT